MVANVQSRMTWAEIEARRQTLGLSREEMCRRAGISGDTPIKGKNRGTRPSRPIAAVIAKVLDEAIQP